MPDDPFFSPPFLVATAVVILANAFLRTVGEYYLRASGRRTPGWLIACHGAALLLFVAAGTYMLWVMLHRLWAVGVEIAGWF